MVSSHSISRVIHRTMRHSMRSEIVNITVWPLFWFSPSKMKMRQEYTFGARGSQRKTDRSPRNIEVTAQVDAAFNSSWNSEQTPRTTYLNFAFKIEIGQENIAMKQEGLPLVRDTVIFISKKTVSRSKKRKDLARTLISGANSDFAPKQPREKLWTTGPGRSLFTSYLGQSSLVGSSLKYVTRSFILKGFAHSNISHFIPGRFFHASLLGPCAHHRCMSIATRPFVSVLWYLCVLVWRIMQEHLTWEQGSRCLVWAVVWAPSAAFGK
jgi:hypothetical protein